MEKYLPWDKFRNYDKVSHRCSGLLMMGLKRNASVIYIVIVSLQELAKVECA